MQPEFNALLIRISYSKDGRVQFRKVGKYNWYVRRGNKLTQQEAKVIRDFNEKISADCSNEEDYQKQWPHRKSLLAGLNQAFQQAGIEPVADAFNLENHYIVLETGINIHYNPVNKAWVVRIKGGEPLITKLRRRQEFFQQTLEGETFATLKQARKAAEEATTYWHDNQPTIKN